MDLLLCWLVGPALLLAVTLGLAFALELISGVRVPWSVRPALGLALVMVLAQFGVSTDATAELTIPVIVALGAFGLWMAWSAGLMAGPLPGWAILAGLGVYIVYAAPVLFSGDPTWAGYLKLDDSATWMGLTDHAFEFGRRTDGFAPSTWEALVSINAGNGYPIGSFAPTALMSRVTGQDVAWVLQPSMAVTAGILTLMLAEIAQTIVRGARASAGIAFIAGQSSMLLGYSLWGGTKEVAAATLLALAPLTAWLAIERRDTRLPWLLPGIAAAAFLTVLGPLSAVWLVATLVPLLVVAWRRLGGTAAFELAWKALATTVAATLPQLITPNGFFNPFQSFLFEETELGNLTEPLSIQHVMGIWPAEDFRFDVDVHAGIVILALTVAACAVFAAYTAIKADQPLLPSYVLGGAAAFALVYAVGSPWIDGKGMAIISPALLSAGLVGAVVLIQRTSHLIEGWVVVALAAGLVLYSSFLFYQGVWLAPRDEHRELERIGERFEGEGPMLVTEGSIYGPRHFLRENYAENAKDLRRSTILLRDGSLPDDLNYLDTDAIADGDLAPYRFLVLRRSPVASRPPGEFRRVFDGTYYEVWERLGTPVAGQTLLARLPLGEPPDSAAVPQCGEVQSLAEQAGPEGTLIAQPAGEQFIVDLSEASHPADWSVEGTVFTPDGSGTLSVPVPVPAKGSYRIWVGGDIHSELAVRAGGEADSVGTAINVNRYEPFGPFRLSAGDQEIELRSEGAGLAPGSGADPSPLGPVILQRVETEDLPTIRFPSSDYERLCDVPWDWIEAYG